MGSKNHTTVQAERRRGPHLGPEERGAIKALKKHGFGARAISRAIGCAPSTVTNELERGTPLRRKSPRLLPEAGGEAVYKAHRANSRKPRKAVMDAMAALWAEYGERFPQVLKTITVGNGSGFAGFAQTEVWGSIEPFTDEDILASADGMNGRPRRKLGYCTPEELFEAFLDTVYTA